MAPLPKSKRSRRRQANYIRARKAEKNFPQLVECANCGKKKVPHQLCKYCGK